MMRYSILVENDAGSVINDEVHLPCGERRRIGDEYDRKVSMILVHHVYSYAMIRLATFSIRVVVSYL